MKYPIELIQSLIGPSWKKYSTLVLFIVLVLNRDTFSLEPTTLWCLTIGISAYFLGQGIADMGKCIPNIDP